MARRVDISVGLNAAGVRLGRKKANQDIDAIIKRVDTLESRLKRTGKTAKKTGDLIGRTMRSGRAGALSLNRIVQDMPFGFIAIQNNVTELAASFTVMRQNGLTAADSVKAILSQFKGPGGFLFLISAAVALITAFGGKIVEAFSKGKTSVEDYGKAIDKILVIERKLTKLRIEEIDVAASIVKTEAEINRIRDIGTFRAAQAAKATGALVVAGLQLTKVERERLRVFEAQLEDLEEADKLTKDLIAAEEALVKVGAKVVNDSKNQTRALKELLDIKREVAKIAISEADLPASIARGQAEIRRLRDIEFETSQLTKAQAKRLKGIQLLLEQLKEEQDETRELALTQELIVLVGGKVVDKQKKIKTAFEQVQESVKQLRAELRSLKKAGIDPLVDLEQESARLVRQLTRLQNLVKAIADPQKVKGREGFFTFEIADVLRREFEKQENEQVAAQNRTKKFTDAQIAEYNRLVAEVQAAAGKINLALAAIANAEVIEETFGNFAGAFGDLAEIRQDTIERDLERENETLENSLNERTQRFIEAGLSEVEARRRANQQINRLQEENANKAAAAINRQFRLQKAFAVAEAVVATFNAANKALASAPPPFSFVLMASTIAAGLANVAAIVAARPGGSTGGGGSRGGSSAGASSTPAALGGIQVQNRGFTTGATGAALGARAPNFNIIVGLDPLDLFKINVELKNADGIRGQVGAT